jgi:hypothetical protein
VGAGPPVAGDQREGEVLRAAADPPEEGVQQVEAVQPAGEGPSGEAGHHHR